MQIVELLKDAMRSFKWPFKFGKVEIRIEDGKATLITVSETTKL